MPYETQWLVPNRVILTRIFGKVTQEEIENLIADIEAKLEAGTPFIHHISDGTEMDKIEINLKTIRLMLGGKKRSEILGWQIDVIHNPINKMISSIGNQIAGVRYRAFNTIQDAVAFLNENDPTLPEIDLKKTLPSLTSD